MTAKYYDSNSKTKLLILVFTIAVFLAIIFCIIALLVSKSNQKEQKMQACHSAIPVSIDDNHRGTLTPITKLSDEQISENKQLLDSILHCLQTSVSEQASKKEYLPQENHREQKKTNRNADDLIEDLVGLGMATHGNPMHYISGPSPF